MSNKKAKVYIILLLFFLLLSCDSTQGIINTHYNFEFKYLPSKYSTYNAELFFYDIDENIIDEQDVANVSSDGSQYFEIDVPENTYYVTIYLFIESFEEPMYVGGIRYNTDDSSNICHKWFIYELISYDRYRYGISTDLIFTLDDDLDFNLNFKDYPYYIFKVYSPYDYTYMLTHFSSIGGEISVHTYLNKGDSYEPFTDYTYEGGSGTYTKVTNKFYIRVTPGDPFVSTLAKLKIDMNPIINLSAPVTDMIHISNGNKLVALTEEDSKLHIIDIENSTIEEEIDIGIDNVSDITYSTLYNTIYGVGTETEGLFSYNLDRQELNKFDFSTSTNSPKLEVDEYNNMLYLLKSSLIYRTRLDDLSNFEYFSINWRDDFDGVYFANDYIFLKDDYSLFQAIRTDEGLMETEVDFHRFDGFDYDSYALNPSLSKVVLYNRYNSLNCYDVETKSLYSQFSDDPENLGSIFFNSTGTHFYTVESENNMLVRYSVDDPASYTKTSILTESLYDSFIINDEETKLFGTLTLDNGDNVIYIQDINVE